MGSRQGPDAFLSPGRRDLERLIPPASAAHASVRVLMEASAPDGTRRALPGAPEWHEPEVWSPRAIPALDLAPDETLHGIPGLAALPHEARAGFPSQDAIHDAAPGEPLELNAAQAEPPEPDAGSCVPLGAKRDVLPEPVSLLA